MTRIQFRLVIATLFVWGCGDDPASLPLDSDAEIHGAEVTPPADALILTELGFEIRDPELAEFRSTELVDVGLSDHWQPGPGEAGYPCDKGTDCTEGLCILTPDGKQCTMTCEEECPFGWECVQYAPSRPDQVFICAPRFMDLCRPCNTNDDCLANGADLGQRCVDYDGDGGFCGAACQTAEDCPSGYGCEYTMDVSGAVASQCVIAQGECVCTQLFADEGAWTDCYVDNDAGVCPGTRACTAQGLAACSAVVPTAEACNGTDDDCDGDVDEDTSGGQCLLTNQFGTCAGEEFCLGGKLDCQGTEAVVEACDGQDNDCDGQTDEGFTDTDNDGVADCMETDKDGDGVVDGLDNCESDFNPSQDDADFDTVGDVCDPDDDNDQVPDQLDCAPFDYDAHPGAVEQCNGKDDNCNAIVDEGFPDNDADGWKDCVDEDDDGDGINDELDCAPLNPLAYPGADELCNGDDDNCDGGVDEGFADLDGDGHADCVDEDQDGDQIPDLDDNCDAVANPGQADQDQDTVGDACDNDLDGDSIPNAVDNCPELQNTVQSDIDEDGLGDKCDDDDDGDQILDDGDNCPFISNPDQADADDDGVGDLCEEDKDGDGIPDAQDCAPLNPAVYPGADEACDGEDNDCDLLQDEGFPDLDKDGLKNCVDPDDDDDGDADDADCQPLDPMISHLAQEVCDGVDNNCDSKIDEGLGDLSCGKGECFNTVPACSAGKLQTCDPFQGVAVEVCDGLDNDCDGLVDEDLGSTTCGAGACLHTAPNCLAGSPQVCDPLAGAQEESCDGFDNDCDGKTDEDMALLACGKGNCFHTTSSCVGGQVQLCDPFDGKSQELCDGVDNDCDGETDEELGSTTCGFGECEHTIDNCVAGISQICNPFQGAAPETCDTLDNDCDGLIDEDLGLLSCGIGVCQNSVPACQNGEPGQCNPLAGASEELCADKLDNDCDGVVDDLCGPNGAGVCLEEVCVSDVKDGDACDANIDCQSGHCIPDWGGAGHFCGPDADSCADVDDGLVVFHSTGWVECDGEGDGYRVCQGGIWDPSPPDPPVACAATVCDGGCGFVEDADNACVSGPQLQVDAGCEFEDLGTDVTCIDCGHLTASPEGCDAGIENCSKDCGASCLASDPNDTTEDVCYEDANGDAWNRVDVCVLDGDKCEWFDDGHESDTLEAECGDFDCEAGKCYDDCGGDDALCNDGLFCGADNACHDAQDLLPWAMSGNHYVLSKDDGLYFNGSDCPGNFFGKNETTVQSVPFRVGPHLVGGNMAGLKPSAVVNAPYGSFAFTHVHLIFPGGRCSGQPLSVTFNYVDGGTYTTGQAGIPHDCSSAGTWSGTNYQIVHQGTYGGPCCDHWYYGRFTNPEPAKQVKSFKVYYTDGCSGEYDGQMWAVTIN